MPKVSILIPTHNRCEILARTLNSLQGMERSQDNTLELVVVANACTDATEQVVTEKLRTFPFPGRCICESKVGLSYARNRCMREASGDILAFLDDDVWVEPGWLRGMLEVYDRFPADVVGGRVRLWWDAVRPPPWLSPPVRMFLSEYDRGDAVEELPGRGGGILGANFSFRRAVYSRIGEFKVALGRVGNNSAGGEESDYYLRAVAAGFRCYYAPDAIVKHWVAPHRLTQGYLDGVSYGAGRASILMKETLSARQFLRSLAGRPYLLAKSGCAELWSTLRGNERARIRWRLERLAALGGLTALFHRFLCR
ncbi:MAG TPA: glycosyltransferase family 2 protein [Tepidisphaeraceae bacterium]